MAPLLCREYQYACESIRYASRTTKRGEEDLSLWRNVNTSQINVKKDFFRSIGLQMKRFQCHAGALHSSRKTKKPASMLDNVKLRNCRVVILGVRCTECSEFFKCETDLNEHTKLQHYGHARTDLTSSNNSRYIETNTDTCETYSNLSEDVPRKSMVKVQEKVQLVLKIGRETIGKRAFKRKYLKGKSVDSSTQTESSNSTETVLRKNVQESVSGIDFPMFENSPYRCCSSTVHTDCSTNQYLAGNNVASKQTNHEGSISHKDSSIFNGQTESRATTANENICTIQDVSSSTIPSSLNVKDSTITCNTTIQQNIVPNENDYLEKYSIVQQNGTISNNNTSNDLRVLEERLDQITVSDKDGIKNTLKVIENVPKQAVQTHQENIIINYNLNDLSPTHKSQEQETLNRVQVILPVIMPIVVSNNDTTRAPAKVTPAVQQQTTKLFHNNEHESDDEVQEVLRITRGYSNKGEINHESPTRTEQEMLVQDAIRNMIRMEEQGWHLLEKGGIEFLRKKKLNARNSDANDELAKKKRRMQQNSENNNNNKITVEDKHFSRAKEPSSKGCRRSHNAMYLSDNVKENLITCNGNINIPAEVLRRYGINYDNEVYEINNNIESAQGLSGCILAPRSGATERWSNKPTVIDLVNETD